MNIKKWIEDISKSKALDESIDDIIREMGKENPRMLLALDAGSEH